MGLRDKWNDLTPRAKTYWVTLVLALGLGGIIGALFAPDAYEAGHRVGQAAAEGHSVPLSFTIDPTQAIIAVVVANLFLWPITWIWHRSVDEHEMRGYADGAIIAGYALIGLAGSWWVLSAADLTPEPDLGLAILVFCVIWTAVWAWKKYR